MAKRITLLKIIIKNYNNPYIGVALNNTLFFSIVVIKYLSTSIIVILQSQGNNQMPQINGFLLIVMMKNVLWLVT